MLQTDADACGSYLGDTRMKSWPGFFSDSPTKCLFSISDQTPDSFLKFLKSITPLNLPATDTQGTDFFPPPLGQVPSHTGTYSLDPRDCIKVLYEDRFSLCPVSF